MYYGSLNNAADQADAVASPRQSYNINMVCPTPSSKANINETIRRGTAIKLKTYIQIMHHLGFISINPSNPKDEELLTELWKELQGTNDDTLKAENLLVILGAVMNT